MLSQDARQALYACQALGQADTKLQWETVHLIGGFGAVMHQRLKHTMQNRQDFLGFSLRSNKTHRRT